ncbi:MAG: DUF192 domain-containing protein [Endomicrobium sp.]|jgi:uncharacterized membrane protein (UPF0127 family)|nr:DUF192 domain-containing protein [Endomicrobium sp.]
MRKFILRCLIVVILTQTFFSVNSYAKTYNRHVSIPSALINKPDINKYVDGETLNAKINSQSLKLLVAKKRETIIKGLSWRDKIPFDGMIFFFDKPRKASFWMRGMKFPLDIVWVQNNIIVGVTENVKPEPGVPEKNLKLYPSPAEVDAVIELSAGRAKQLNIKEGNILIL